MDPLPPPMYHYLIVFKNGRTLNVVSGCEVHPDKTWRWIEFGLEDANNKGDWSCAKRVTVRASSIMYIALLYVDRYDTQNV